MSATTETGAEPARPAETRGPLVYRQSVFTRLSHWVWAVCLFFLLLSGLQIFNAHPALYIGHESGFEYDNAVLRIEALRRADGSAMGRTTVFGLRFDTTGVLGASGPAGRQAYQAFPPQVTIPSFRDLATGRVVHFFFAWVFAGALAIWLVAGLVTGHVRRDLVPGRRDVTGLPRDVWGHLRLRFVHGRSYGPLQKWSYAIVLFVLFPLIILTGLAMSPGMNAAWPFLIEMFGGRQTARTIHFGVMVLLVAFVVVHVLMVVLSGPINAMRSMITGWYRTAPGTETKRGDRP